MLRTRDSTLEIKLSFSPSARTLNPWTPKPQHPEPYEAWHSSLPSAPGETVWGNVAKGTGCKQRAHIKKIEFDPRTQKDYSQLTWTLDPKTLIRMKHDTLQQNITYYKIIQHNIISLNTKTYNTRSYKIKKAVKKFPILFKRIIPSWREVAFLGFIRI